MKANEFVKKFGWVHSKYIAEKWYNPHKSFDTKTYHTTYYLDNSGETSLVELKRLVESYELVERVGGLSIAKDFCRDFECIHIGLDLIECRRLIKAIADVEACKEVS